jgi:hypothetical protein
MLYIMGIINLFFINYIIYIIELKNRSGYSRGIVQAIRVRVGFRVNSLYMSMYNNTARIESPLKSSYIAPFCLNTFLRFYFDTK